jgi:hypothetical protein
MDNAQKLAIIFAMMMFLATGTPPPSASSFLEKSRKSMYCWISAIENGVQATPSALVRFSGQRIKRYVWSLMNWTYELSLIVTW